MLKSFRPAPDPAERRITVRMVAYWERLRNGRTMPCENDIDPDDLADLWGYCFIVQLPEGAAPHYSYLGRAILEAYRGGLAPGGANGLVGLDAATLTADFAAITQTRKPLMHEGEFANLKNETVKYRQCLLPLGVDERVESVFGGMRFKVFPAGA